MERMMELKGVRALSKIRRASCNTLTFAEDDKDEVVQAYKSRVMTHDIHRVRELSALLEERRRYFDGQLGEVYRNAGVSSPSTSLPRLRALDSPPISASVSESNMTDLSFGGSDMTTAGSLDVQSACSARSYSIFADDECSVADSYEFAETKARLGRNWSSSTLLGAANGASSKAKISNLPMDSLHNEVMRAADLEKKLKSRRASLPLALETSLRRSVPAKKKSKQLAHSSTWRRREEFPSKKKSLTIQYDSSEDEFRQKNSQEGGGGAGVKNVGEGVAEHHFSMAEALSKTRKYDVANDLKRALELPGVNLLGGGRKGLNNKNFDSLNWDSDVVIGGAPRLKTGKFSPRRSIGSKSASSTLAPYADYSPRSSLSTLSGSYPRIAFTSLEKVYREEGESLSRTINSSKYGMLLKPLTNQMELYQEQGQVEPDYSHDFRYLSLLDALVPCLQRQGAVWKAGASAGSEVQLGQHHPYRPQHTDFSLGRLF